ncbi:conserved hypothetical protein [Chlorobium ferrooxidans DSM 13031]|uniref:Uncharacterized protein n=2 Tax=Chlorobium TaxID=1091 RepID=Q0YQ50_9CHLB|nr:conserved hypothetical protein [Chlorobium ferrooxidans DSM 13031]
MKFFPDKETRKRFMKPTLTAVVGVAWLPIVWLLITATFGTALSAFTGSWIAAHSIILLIAIFVTLVLLRLFIRLGDKIKSGSQ